MPQLLAVQRTLATLVSVDPDNASWARREGLARARMAAALAAAGQRQAAQREIDGALARLRKLYAANPSDLSGRLALVEALLAPRKE